MNLNICHKGTHIFSWELSKSPIILKLLVIVHHFCVCKMSARLYAADTSQTSSPGGYQINSVVKDSCNHTKESISCKCSCNCQWILLKRKGAIITLLWSFSAFSVFHFIIKVNTSNITQVKDISYFRYYDGIIGNVTALCVPLFGWIADTYCGRYKTTKYGLLVMWIASIALGLVYLIKLGNVQVYLISIILFVMLIGLSAFQANIIQLGTDQFYDSSAQEIVSYIILYVWTFNASGIVVQFTQVCFLDSDCLYLHINRLFLPVLLSLALVSDALCSHWLVIEPVTCNPLKLIFKVLQYSVRNKYPRLRSAFTYWDDKPYSRIDLAKNKYGGPFTTEQVEDVKTFFRMIALIVIVSVFIGVLLHGSSVITVLSNKSLNNLTHLGRYRVCFKRVAIGNAGEIFVFLFLPLYGAFFLPFLWKFMSSISILKKCGLSLFLLLLCAISLLVLQLVHDLHQKTNKDAISCNLNNGTLITYDVIGLKFIAPSMMAGIGQALVLLTCIEFICAQAPYSMKGLLFGFMYVGIAASLFSIYTLTQIFAKISWKGAVLDCGFWLLFVCTVITVMLIIMFVGASVCYKKRERDDNLPNQHCFAENYYDRYCSN